MVIVHITNSIDSNAQEVKVSPCIRGAEYVRSDGKSNKKVRLFSEHEKDEKLLLLNSVISIEIPQGEPVQEKLGGERKLQKT